MERSSSSLIAPLLVAGSHEGAEQVHCRRAPRRTACRRSARPAAVQLPFGAGRVGGGVGGDGGHEGVSGCRGVQVFGDRGRRGWRRSSGTSAAPRSRRSDRTCVWCSTRSSSRCATSVMKGSSMAMRRGTNAVLTRVRSRVWSGGSAWTRCRLRPAGPGTYPGNPARVLAQTGSRRAERVRPRSGRSATPRAVPAGARHGRAHGAAATRSTGRDPAPARPQGRPAGGRLEQARLLQRSVDQQTPHQRGPSRGRYGSTQPCWRTQYRREEHRASPAHSITRPLQSRATLPALPPPLTGPQVPSRIGRTGQPQSPRCAPPLKHCLAPRPPVQSAPDGDARSACGHGEGPGVFIFSLEHLSSFSRESRGVRLNVRDDSFPKSVVVRDSGGEPWQRRSRRHHVPVLVVLLLFPLVLLLVDLLTPPDIRLGPVMVAAPVFSAAFPVCCW